MRTMMMMLIQTLLIQMLLIQMPNEEYGVITRHAGVDDFRAYEPGWGWRVLMSWAGVSCLVQQFVVACVSKVGCRVYRVYYFNKQKVICGRLGLF